MAEETPEPSELEDKVNDTQSNGFIRKAIDLGFKTAWATGATALSIATTGTTGLLVGGALGGGAFIGGLLKKGKSFYDTTYDAIKTYGALNAVIYPMIWLGDVTFPLFEYGSKLSTIAAKTAYSLTAYLATFIGLFRGSSHLIDHKLNPIGIDKSLTEDFWPEYKRLLAFAPSLALVANGVPAPVYKGLELPWFALNAPPVSFYNNYSPPAQAHSSKPSHSPDLVPEPA